MKTMKKWICRIAKDLMVVTLIASMALGSASFVAKAAEQPADIQNTYEIDGVTYYNAGSAAFAEDSDLFLKDVIGGQSDALSWQYEGSEYTYNRSMSDLWLETAAGILRGRDQVNTDGRFVVLIDKSASQASPYYSNAEYGEANKYFVKNMMSDDMETPKKAESYLYQAAGFSSSEGTTGYFKNDTSKNTTIVSAVKAKVGSNYRTAAVYFNNFKVVPLFPADEGKNFVTSTVDDSTNYSKVVASNVRNNTAQTVQGTQSLAKSYTASVSSTVSGSETYTYEESIKVGAEFKFGFFEKLGVEASFTATQAFEKGWEEQKAKEESNESTQELSVELPPYTNVMMQQKTSTAEFLTNYNCPVGVTFDATVVIYDKDGVYKVDNTACAFKYHNNARKTLAKRYKEYKNADRKDSDGINWTRVKDYDTTGNIKTHIAEALGKVTTFVPDSPAGAQLKQKMDVVSGEVTGIMPIYPLKKVKASQKSLGMNVGDSQEIDGFELEGLNEQNAPYYGFSANKGYWKVVDKNGNPIYDDAPAEIVRDPMSGDESLEAVKEGTCYLKYFIDEYKYNTANNPNHYTTNDELDSTAVIKIDVDDEKTIEVKGSYEGYVNEAPEAIDADGKLNVAVYDSSGIEIDAGDVTWEKREKDGITLDGNMVSFTKPGTYHVRARSGKLVSEFVEITAKERTTDPTTEAPTEVTTEAPTVAPTKVTPVTTKKSGAVKPGKAKVVKAIKKKSAKKIKVSLKKVNGAKGYEVAVFKSKKAKKALVKKTTIKLKLTIKSKKLKSKKTLYVKARAYVMNGASKLFGDWSAFKKSKK